MPALLNNQQLEQSDIVANCTMNRQRTLHGPNGYDRELRFDLLEFLRAVAQEQGQAYWLDCCCGQGEALWQAVSLSIEQGWSLHALGIDLVDFFTQKNPPSGRLEFLRTSLLDWNPDRTYDLISCVHGLHYLGDKLQAISKLSAALSPAGKFLAHLDLQNIQIQEHANSPRRLAKLFRDHGFHYNARTKLLTCTGPTHLDYDFLYLGADDTAGPNYTGQPVVHSYYQASE